MAGAWVMHKVSVVPRMSNCQQKLRVCLPLNLIARELHCEVSLKQNAGHRATNCLSFSTCITKGPAKKLTWEMEDKKARDGSALSMVHADIFRQKPEPRVRWFEESATLQRAPVQILIRVSAIHNTNLFFCGWILGSRRFLLSTLQAFVETLPRPGHSCRKA